MLKIMDIHPAATAAGEYIVLQNQGLTTVSLRGWALCTDTFLQGDPAVAAREMYIFANEEAIKPYTRVVLFTGEGENGWRATNDGKQAYVAYWGQQERVWSLAVNVHLLHIAASRRIVLPEEAFATYR